MNLKYYHMSMAFVWQSDNACAQTLAYALFIKQLLLCSGCTGVDDEMNVPKLLEQFKSNIEFAGILEETGFPADNNHWFDVAEKALFKYFQNNNDQLEYEPELVFMYTRQLNRIIYDLVADEYTGIEKELIDDFKDVLVTMIVRYVSAEHVSECKSWKQIIDSFIQAFKAY